MKAILNKESNNTSPPLTQYVTFFIPNEMKLSSA